MRRLAASGILVLALGPAASARYSNLIASADGRTVYFQADTGMPGGGWYAARAGAQVTAFPAAGIEVSDVSGSGLVYASSFVKDRVCGFAGSTCFLAPACSASYQIKGPGIDLAYPSRSAFVRLDRSGQIAWIAEERTCPGLGRPVPGPGLHGLYEIPSLRLLAPAGEERLASQRRGRRLITDGGRALAFSGIQLTWLDASGSHPIRHVAGAFEAVADACGENIVYVEEPVGELHWIAADDEDLYLTGSAPALSDDGRTLVYLSPEGVLQAYDRPTRQVRRLADGTHLEFAIGGDAAFAVTSGNRLVRIDLATGAETTLAEPFPEIQTVAAPEAPLAVSCPLICYGPPPWFSLGRGMLLLFRGRYLDQRGWRVRLGDVDLEWHSISDEAAWVQVPGNFSGQSEDRSLPLEIDHPDHFVRIGLTAVIVDRAIACFGTLHGDFSRAVSTGDPASPGEVVHVFLTGLRGVETVADGEPNPLDRLIPVADPPLLEDPGFAEPLFFGLAPGLIAVQQLDLRVLRPPSPPGRLFSGYECAAPPVTTQSPDFERATEMPRALSLATAQ